MLNKAIVASFLATSAFAFGIAARAETLTPTCAWCQVSQEPIVARSVPNAPSRA